MTTKTIAALDAASSVSPTDEVPIDNGATQKTTVAALVAAGMVATQLFSLPRIAELVNASIAAGNYTAGRKFWVIGDSITCTGVRFFHKSGGTPDFKVTLVDKDGTTIIEQKTVTAAPDNSIVEVTWDATHVLAASATDFYRVMVYETSGTSYIHYTPPTFGHAQADTMPWYSRGSKQVLMGRSGYRAGDSPAGALSGNYYVFGDGGDFYAVEPVFE